MFMRTNLKLMSLEVLVCRFASPEEGDRHPDQQENCSHENREPMKATAYSLRCAHSPCAFVVRPISEPLAQFNQQDAGE